MRKADCCEGDGRSWRGRRRGKSKPGVGGGGKEAALLY